MQADIALRNSSFIFDADPAYLFQFELKSVDVSRTLSGPPPHILLQEDI